MKGINKKLIISIALIFVILLILTNNTLAVLDDLNEWNPEPKVEGDTFIEKAGILLGWIKYIGIMVSVIALAAIGIKFLFGSTEEKAEYKKTLFPYVVGCFMLMGTSLIIALIEANFSS